MLWFVLLSGIFSQSGLSLDCVDLPPLPSHGTFRVRGAFRARLKCSTDSEDIALNAPGDQGVLFCDPESTFSFDTAQVKKPPCTPRLVPSIIMSHLLIGYLVPVCQGEPWESFKSDIRAVLDVHMMSAPTPCGRGQDPCLAQVSFTCQQNWQYKHSNFTYQAEVKFTLATQFDPNKGLDFYADVVTETRRRLAFTDQEDLSRQQREMLRVGNTEVIYCDLISWTGTCVEHRNTLGTTLELSGDFTCRGCPPKYVLRQGLCEPCKYNTYTDSPFQDKCSPCPPENVWRDRELMVELCYTRP